MSDTTRSSERIVNRVVAKPEPDGPAGHLEHVGDAAGEARPRLVEHPDRGRGDRRVEEPGADPGRQQPGDERGVAGVGVEEAEQQRPGRERGGAGEDHLAHPDPRADALGEERDGAERAEHRQHREAGLERAVAEDLLHQLRHVEDRA